MDARIHAVLINTDQLDSFDLSIGQFGRFKPFDDLISFSTLTWHKDGKCLHYLLHPTMRNLAADFVLYMCVLQLPFILFAALDNHGSPNQQRENNIHYQRMISPKYLQ